MSTIMVCDDSAVVRENLRRTVAGIAGVTRAVATSSGEEVLARFGAERPDLVLMDVRMPGLGGVETARRLLARHPGAAVLMLTVAEDVDGVARAIAAGARGYVVKDATRQELTAAVLGSVNGASRSRPVRRRPEEETPALTERELQVLTGMGRGRSNAEIGRELFLSEDTVKTHARRLFRKLGAADRAHAVAKGFRLGLVP